MNLQQDNQDSAVLFYFTGTGNSLWTAKLLAKELGNTEVISMVKWQANPTNINPKVVGLVFPVHIWGVPRRVLDFIDCLSAMSPDYLFAVATNGGQVSNTLIQLKKFMADKNMDLKSGWSVELPSNYIPWGGPGSQEKQQNLFRSAQLKIGEIAKQVKAQNKLPVEKGPLWQRLIFTPIYKKTFEQVPRMDNKFWVDDRCDQCLICTRLCPSQNIILKDDHLVWQRHCDQCLACLQWCPKEALQYGSKTPAYQRYHHPEIKLKDIF